MARQPDSQKELQQALQQQQKNSETLDRILWIFLPILALLLSTIFANWNILSTIGTAFVLTIAFIVVGIKKKSLAATLAITLLYCLVDNYLSYGFQFNITGLKRQLLSMVLFIAIIGLVRPMAERAMIKR
ncbi:hypothetical protein GCM10023206_02630 [Acinetobacter puyangensis]|uniref:Uncharacterized protein n=1 Tax=Acinetobacter puyangensis TaxID=1096779 RepID=A0A240E6K8_9GAMM|nr:hypothetical protein [Acinetobacter puyangensis]SNX44387.1 hypothetical protein SAMN05421731_103125 [Acinetobacter puyangensis]